MAKRTMATPGHSGGSGFDPMSSGGARPDSKSGPEAHKPEQEGWGPVIGAGLFALAAWALNKWLGEENEDSTQ